jgi:iron complex transport system substrate-binding protein
MSRAVASMIACCLFGAGPAVAGPPVERVISLNPSLTEIVVALGATESLVAVDSASQRQRAEFATLPSVGGLFDPSLEAVVSLRPDLVLLVPSVEQRDFYDRLVELGVPTVRFDNLRFEEVLDNIQVLGGLVGREAKAARRVAAIQAVRGAVEQAVSEKPRVRCLVVLQHDPIFVVGGESFLDEQVRTAGCDNLGRELGAGYPRASLEWVIAAAPEVILEASPIVQGKEAQGFWQRLPAIPAVASGRVQPIDAQVVTMPGPALDQALRLLARALHGPAIDAEIEVQLRGVGP